MKKFAITGLLTFFLATTFLSDNPPGWYQKQLPVSKAVTDIFFLDSLIGWTCTNWDPEFDTAYIMKTMNGGNNWEIQLRHHLSLKSIQFIDENIGYSAGGDGSPKFLYTTNGGANWTISTPLISTNRIVDLKFVNKDTGWICSDDAFAGGIFKTTNGGTSWQRQTTVSQLAPLKLFFLNRDTGWALAEGLIAKTVNGGTNWDFLHIISGIERGLFFLNNDTGWVISGGMGQNGIIKTMNGGANWFVQKDPRPFGSGLNDIYIVNDSKGWIATDISNILSLKNDSTWGTQNAPSPPGIDVYHTIMMIDTNIGYAGGEILIKTDDGGGTITNAEETSEIVSENFILYQNYPNPFNPSTIIKYEIKATSYVELSVYDMLGKEKLTLVKQRLRAGKHEVQLDGTRLSSGIYFYKLNVTDEKTNEIFFLTKKMILIR